MKTYDQAMGKLTGRCRISRKLGNNTYLEHVGDNACVLYHRTRIVTFRPDGCIRLLTGGWQTKATKERISDYSPISIYQRKHEWFFRWRGEEYKFRDGMVVTPSGQLLTDWPDGEQTRAMLPVIAQDVANAMELEVMPQPARPRENQ